MLKSKPIIWSNEQIEFLKINYSKIGAKKCGEILKIPHYSITKKANKLKLFLDNKWTANEIQFLKDNYEKYGPGFCTLNLNRTRGNIFTRARKYNLLFIPKLVASNSNNKICSTCRTEKTRECFDKSPNRKHNSCKECRQIYRDKHKKEISEYSRLYAEKNKDKIKFNHKARKEKILSDPIKRRAYCLIHKLHGIQQRARNKNLEFDLDHQWMFDNDKGFCPIFKIEFIYSSTKKHPNSISLDRIDNNKGYTKDNCIFISLRANQIKNDGTPEDLYKIAAFYENLRSQREDYSI